MPASSEKEVSVFVDESGSYDATVSSSLYYFVCMVFHDQADDLSQDIERLESAIENIGYDRRHCVHTSPLIRREGEYLHDTREMRRQLFYAMLSFVRKSKITYRCFTVDKAFVDTTECLHDRLLREMLLFLVNQGGEFDRYDRIKVYYDHGQDQVQRILKDAFALFSAKTVFVPEVTPAKYRLFQAADLICTLELIKRKLQDGGVFTLSENLFFGGARNFKRKILSQIEGKRSS